MRGSDQGAACCNRHSDAHGDRASREECFTNALMKSGRKRHLSLNATHTDVCAALYRKEKNPSRDNYEKKRKEALRINCDGDVTAGREREEMEDGGATGQRLITTEWKLYPSPPCSCG